MIKIFKARNLLRTQNKLSKHSILFEKQFSKFSSKNDGDDNAGPNFSERINSNFPKMEELIEKAEKDSKRGLSIDDVNLYEELKET